MRIFTDRRGKVVGTSQGIGSYMIGRGFGFLILLLVLMLPLAWPLLLFQHTIPVHYAHGLCTASAANNWDCTPGHTPSSASWALEVAWLLFIGWAASRIYKARQAHKRAELAAERDKERATWIPVTGTVSLRPGRLVFTAESEFTASGGRVLSIPAPPNSSLRQFGEGVTVTGMWDENARILREIQEAPDAAGRR
jgi:hypothetical protein